MSSQRPKSAQPSAPASPVDRALPDDRFGEEEGPCGDGRSRHEDYEEEPKNRDAAHRDFHDQKPDPGGQGPC